jgi:retinol dehydrogenase 12
MTSPHPQSANDKIALVTGGTFGIGRATALALAHQGLEVVITGRDTARTRETVAAIQRQTGNQRVFALIADFFDPANVLTLAEEFTLQYPHLDVLVNNAGGNFSERKLISGFERTWALNHLAYVQLALRLLPLLKSSTSARILNVASGWYAGKLNFDNLQGEQRFEGNAAYFQSKLANILFTYALARRLAGTNVTVNAVNPGMIATGLEREVKGIGKFLSSLLNPLRKPVEQGAFPSFYMAVSTEVEGMTGLFFDVTKFATTTAITHDQAIQERLWRVSLEQLGLSDWGQVWARTPEGTSGSIRDELL